MRYTLKTILLLIIFAGFLHAFRSLSAQETDLELTTEERNWISTHSPVTVANELDWPPFDFAEDGEPKVYSMYLFQIVSEKTGLTFEFVNGYSWAEIVEKFNAGELDMLPAIYSTEERRESMVFTKPYASNPSILVVHSKS